MAGETIEVQVVNAEALFSVPPLDPLAGRLETMSGFDRVYDAIEGMRKGTVPTLSLTVGGAAPPAATIIKAFHDFAEAQGRFAHRQLRVTQRDGLRTLWLGLGVLAICMALSAATSSPDLPVQMLMRLLSNGFVIAGWVALWHPVELLLYDTSKLRQQVRIFGVMSQLPINVSTPNNPDNSAH